MPSLGMSLRPGTPQSQLWSYMCWLWWSRTLLGVLVPQVCVGGRSLLFWERERSAWVRSWELTLKFHTEIPIAFLKAV